MLVGVLPRLLLVGVAVAAVLLCDPILERIVGQRLDKQVPDGFQHGGDLGARLPVLRLEDAEADVAEGVVGDVGVVDAGEELDGRRLEGVLGG